MNYIKHKLIFILLLFTVIQPYCQGTGIIQSCTVHADTVFEGAKGILLSYEYRFPKKDSAAFDIFKGAGFKITTQVLERNDPVYHNYGFQDAMPGNVFIVHIPINEIKAGDTSHIISQFIPYAAFKLPPGEKQLTLRPVFSGKDGFGKKYEEAIGDKIITASLPVQKTIELRVEAIEVTPFNEIGQAWDYSMFKTSAPDLKVSALLGGITVARSKTEKDSYIFGNERKFSARFAISEGDEVQLRVADEDFTYDDLVVAWRISTTGKAAGNTYFLPGTAANVKACKAYYIIR